MRSIAATNNAASADAIARGDAVAATACSEQTEAANARQRAPRRTRLC